ncbi:MAG: AMP-binding protein [Deltaproteobacteria bacterium]|nr:AMP-binding protein [Deltaproteobacteria bacterium]
MIEHLRQRARDAAFAARVVRSSGLAGAFRPAGLPGFLRSLVGAGIGPHLAVAFHAHNTPDKEAIVEPLPDGTTRRLTWRELDRAANQLGHALVARGVGGGDRVALMLPNGTDTLVAQQALARIGGIAVQIGYRLKAAEIAYILGNATPAATLCHAQFEATMAAARASAAATDPLLIVGAPAGDTSSERWEDAVAAITHPHPPRSRGGGGIIVYTSGTTGKPKGAARTWKQTGIDAVADMMVQVGMQHADRHLVVCPLYHSAAPAFVAITMSLGGTVVLMNSFDAEGALALIERERITSMLVVPTMLVRLNALPDEVRRRYDTRSLRWVMSGAAQLATDTARRFQEQFGPILWNFYGATETGVVSLAGPGDHLTRPGTIGKLVRGNEVRLLDATGHAVPEGSVGELYARNAMLIGGYHRNALATHASMRDGFFSVGDLARRDADGYYYLESRTHDMVISGGVNIYPREIEDHLASHPAVLEAAVIGVPDVEWGESLRAYVVRRPGAVLDEAGVIAWCREGLADYKRPRAVVFLDELPRNPTGKVLKRELRRS